VPACNSILNHPDVSRQQLAPPFATDREFAEQHANSADRRYVVAESDGVPTGFGSLRLYSGRRSHAAAIEIVVDPDQANYEVPMALLGALVDLGENWYGVRRLELKVYVDDDRSIALYEQFGFEVEATHREFAQREGVYADAYSMARLLR